MSAEVQTALVNEVLEQAHMFRQNAALQRGLPGCSPARSVGTVERPKQEPPVVNIVNEIPAAVAAPSSSPGTVAVAAANRSLAQAAAPYILTALGAGGIAAGASYLMRDTAPPPSVQPATNEGSMLQYLQDRGMHLPGGTWPTNP